MLIKFVNIHGVKGKQLERDGQRSVLIGELSPRYHEYSREKHKQEVSDFRNNPDRCQYLEDDVEIQKTGHNRKDYRSVYLTNTLQFDDR